MCTCSSALGNSRMNASLLAFVVHASAPSASAVSVSVSVSVCVSVSISVSVGVGVGVGVGVVSRRRIGGLLK